ncbi:udp-glucose 6-dehydrogenase [Grosmannia clavigera kw1407]|uniref:UDP-glucose 6-dehydrogenase n=1 Tax=Grosmannia clavigera (strain kw1407 / UAMH 11150) TaxID=655863 RepID=F0XJ01_GROCL|nr:udp-glucose 6-dehydrogenase [Grosmannia clavigera kw1407]EFX02075.1 udp-glucose 6-dehydrogenase [Grosmannia clavigera kw1407]
MAALTQVSVIESEEALLDASTAPTTPEGSMSFSPVLRPFRAADTVEDDTTTTIGPGSRLAGNSGRLLPTTLPSPQIPSVRTICCVGAGYVGGPTAAVLAFQNPQIRVAVVDRDPVRIRRWNSRHPPIYEPGLGDIVRIARDGSRACSFVNVPLPGADPSTDTAPISVPPRESNLFFSTEVSRWIGEADVVLIAVNTPTKSRGAGAGSATDMTAFEAVTGEVAKHARPGAIIVEKSTVPCRTAQLVHETMAVHRPGVHFEILSNPEFLAAGTAVNDLLYPDRVLIGSLPTASGMRAAEALAAVYAAWVPRSRIPATNVWSSELAKLVANSMLAQRISSINSIAAICERTGADVDEVAASVGQDPRIGNKFLKAGIGFGGSCFKKDILNLVYLSESLGLDEVAEYWRQVVTMNDYARDRFTHRVVKCLNNTLTGKKATVLGYAFKKNTSDTRESPALEIIKTLLEEGPREIAVFDPCCNPVVIRDEINCLLGGDRVLLSEGGSLQVYTDAYQACADSNCILITTDFDEFGGKPLPGTLVDPRPFDRSEPSENELLALHKFLVGSTADVDHDPLQRFRPELLCDPSCPDCALERDGYKLNEEYRPRAKLDWIKISTHMQKPRWVFDGRGVLDVKRMAKLGLRVESVGRQGRS